MPYQLIPKVFFVEGAKNGVILDTNTGAIYSINSQACKVLKLEVKDDKYWGNLVKIGLAKITDTFSNTSKIPTSRISNRVNFAWFEIVTDDCNERCVHCYANAMPKSYRPSSQSKIDYAMSKIEDLAKTRMSYKNWLTVISEAYKLGCRKCQFIGGEPFLYKGQNNESVLDLAEFSMQLGYEFVEVFTNGTLLTKQKMRRIKDLGISIAISLYSNQSKIHDAITRTPGSYKKTIAAIKGLKDLNIPVRVQIVLMKTNQSTVASTLDFLDTLGISSKKPDPLRPSGRGNNASLRPDFKYLAKFGLILKPDFKANHESIIRYSSEHSCLSGKLAITEFGDVYPCIFARSLLYGNYLMHHSLEKIVSDEITKEVWRSTKDTVMVCQDCEYRYVCFDCRPLSEDSASGKAGFINAPYPRCTYNPYTGEWQGGLWELNSNGDPFYNRKYKNEIEEAIIAIPISNSGGES